MTRTTKSYIMVSVFAVVMLAFFVGVSTLYPQAEPTKAEIDARHRDSFTVICLNAVEYWVTPLHYTHGGMMAPKYSPGNAAPDTCEG